MAETGSQSQFVFSGNIANIIPGSPLKKLYQSWRIMGGGGAWGPPLADGLLPSVPVGEPSSVDTVCMTPGGLVPVVWTGFPDGRDPIITQPPVEVLVRVVDMDVTVDSSQAVPDVIEDRAVVAMVGLDAMQMGEDTPMDCEDKCAKWDIHNNLETVDGMPIYGGDLYDSDESDWEDPCDLAYAEYVERYNLDAPEGMELLVFERSKGPDESVMMVDEVTGFGYVHQTSSSSPLLEADTVCTKPVADVLTVMHDVPDVAGSPNCRSPSEAYGGGAALYYEGDISDSDCGSVEDRERNTWEDLCNSAFRNGYSRFALDSEDPLPPVVFSDKLFWDEDIAEPSGMLSDNEDIPVSAVAGFLGYDGTFGPPDTHGIVRLDNNELALMNSHIGEVSVLSLEICDPSIHSDTLG